MFLNAMDKPFDVSSLAAQIRGAKTLLLSTHKQCDGDGLGAQLALYHVLKANGKDVRVVCVDEVPKKYSFLRPEAHLQVFDQPHEKIKATDLALIFDTNDHRLVEPLYSELEKSCEKILFVDHHPVLSQGPQPNVGSLIAPEAASTGELVYFLIKELGLPFTAEAAEALYTSIVFDTQIFRYVKNSRNSHLICADIIDQVIDPLRVHQRLFSTLSRGKMDFLSQVLGQVEYFENDRIALLKLGTKDLLRYGLDMDDSRDVIDMMMNIQSLQVSALFREDQPGAFKVSLRSKGPEVVDIAEDLGGGGHAFAAGAFIKKDYDELKSFVLKRLREKLVRPTTNDGNKNGKK